MIFQTENNGQGGRMSLNVGPDNLQDIHKEYFTRQCVSMINDGLALVLGSIPAIQFQTFAAPFQTGHIGLHTAFALQLIARQVGIVRCVDPIAGNGLIKIRGRRGGGGGSALEASENDRPIFLQGLLSVLLVERVITGKKLWRRGSHLSKNGIRSESNNMLASLFQ
jgi:hypothetical protein